MPEFFDEEFFDPEFFGGSSIAAAEYHEFRVARDNAWFRYWTDAGAIKGRVEDNAGNVLRSFTAIASGVDAAPITGKESATDGGLWRFVLFYFAGGVLQERFTNDGENFS